MPASLIDLLPRITADHRVERRYARHANKPSPYTTCGVSLPSHYTNCSIVATPTPMMQVVGTTGVGGRRRGAALEVEMCSHGDGQRAARLPSLLLLAPSKKHTAYSGDRIVSWIIYCWLVWYERKTLFPAENLRSFTSKRIG